MRIHYIAEGSQESGIGHFFDIASWANELKDKLLQSKRGIVILDVPKVSTSEVLFYHEQGAKVVTCYSEGHANYSADIAILPTHAPKIINGVKRNDHNVTFYGPKYRILRPEFSRFRDRHQDSGKVEIILVMLGGTDAGNISQAVIEQLRGYETFYAHGRKDIPELLSEVDLAITAPGFSTWEALYVGCPVLIVPQNEYQRQRYSKELPVVDKVEDIPRLIKERQFVYPKPEYEINTGKQEIIKEVLL